MTEKESLGENAGRVFSIVEHASQMAREAVARADEQASRVVYESEQRSRAEKAHRVRALTEARERFAASTAEIHDGLVTFSQRLSRLAEEGTAR